jgi:quercetin dioxygenase-like cupin family protein
MRHKLLLIAVAAAAAATVAGVAIATPPAGVLANEPLGRGTLEPKFKLKLRHSSDEGDTVVQRIVLAPGGHSGWHSHPGVELGIVKSGSVTIYDSTCAGSTYTAGKSFVAPGYGRAHIARNEGATNTELVLINLDVPPGGPARSDEPAPSCAS